MCFLFLFLLMVMVMVFSLVYLYMVFLYNFTSLWDGNPKSLTSLLQLLLQTSLCT